MRQAVYGIRTRLFLIFFLAIIPVVGLLLSEHLARRQLAVEETFQTTQRLARLAAMGHERLLEGARQLLVALSQVPQVTLRRSPTCSQLLAGLLADYPAYANLFALDANGDNYCRGVPFSRPLNAADQPYFQRVREARAFTVGEYHVSPVTGKPVVPLAYPILDEVGHFQGAVVATIDLAWLNQSTINFQLPPGSTLTVLDDEGTILARQPDPERWVGKSVPEAPLVEAVSGQSEGTISVVGLDGVSRFYGFSRPDALPGNAGFHVAIGIPVEEAFADADRYLTRSLAILGLIVTLTLVVGWASSHFFVVRPVDILVEAARQLAAGNLRARSGIVHERGELGRLAGTFDQMAAGLERRETELRQSEQRYRLLFNEMLVGFSLHEIVCDATGRPVDYRFLEVNPAFEALTGLRRDQVVGRTVLEVIPGTEAVWIETYGRVALTGEPAHFESYARELGRHYEVMAYSPQRGQFAVTFSDVTQRKQAEEALRWAAARAESLVRVAARLNAHLDRQAVLRTVCEETRAALDVPGAWISLYDPRRDALVYAAAVGMPAEFAARYTPPPRTLYEEHARRLGPLLVFPDLRVLGDADIPNAQLFADLDVRTIVGASLLRDEQLVGILSVVSFGEVRSFEDGELTLLQGIADQAVQAITNAALLGEAQRRLRQVEALRSVDLAITSSLDLRVTLAVFLDQVAGQLDVDAAAVLLLEPPGQRLRFAAGRGFRDRGIEQTDLHLGEGHAGRAALERQAFHVDCSADHRRECPRASLCAREGFASCHCTPLVAKGQVKGVLELFRRSALSSDGEWESFSEALASQAAIAIDNATLFVDLERANAELTIAYDATIEGWGRALDLRDKETEGHSRRVTEMTLRLARLLGMAEAELAHVRRGALLHDIGKLGVPDAILLKPGPLNDEEWDLMRRHPTYAYELLSSVSFLRPALEIPYCHHERWDGTGYPRGLRGEQIPLAARVFAVVDVWDALRSDRPYRAAWSREETLAYVRERAGTHFDPEVVEAVLAILAEA